MSVTAVPRCAVCGERITIRRPACTCCTCWDYEDEDPECTCGVAEANLKRIR